MIQVDDGDTHEEQTDDTSDVGAPPEEEAERLSEGNPPTPSQDQGGYPA